MRRDSGRARKIMLLRIQRLLDSGYVFLRLFTEILPNFTYFLHEDGHDDFSSFFRVRQSPVR